MVRTSSLKKPRWIDQIINELFDKETKFTERLLLNRKWEVLPVAGVLVEKMDFSTSWSGFSLYITEKNNLKANPATVMQKFIWPESGTFKWLNKRLIQLENGTRIRIKHLSPLLLRLIVSVQINKRVKQPFEFHFISIDKYDA